MNYINGFDRLTSDKIYLRDESGFYGLKSVQLKGTERSLFHFEPVLFMPFNLLGFRMSVFAFTEIGWINVDDQVFSNNMLSAYTVGLRIKNDYLVFGTFQLSFTWFPKVPNDADNIRIDFYELDELRFNNFGSGKPGYISFE